MSYQPSRIILEKYADLLVNFALGGGKGIKKGDLVYLQGSLSALPMFRVLKRAIIQAGGDIIGSLADDMDGFSKYFFDKASNQQLTNFPSDYYKGLVASVDHRLLIIAEHDMHELDKVDPKKMMLMQKSRKPLGDWFDKKENQGKYTWTLALYGTPSMAKEAGLSLPEYWRQIIKACYLDKKDPISEWRRIFREVNRVASSLSKLKIDSLHVEGDDVDLHVKVGKDRKWLSGTGRNIPSFEVFTSPDWRGTEGWIKFNQPLYYFGPKIEGIRLEFKNGRVVKATASKNQKLLEQMLATDAGASQVGEFSLTDSRLSRIDKFMAETLFDENIGGKYGNTHIAVGRSYDDSYTGNASKLTKTSKAALGYNDSAIHVDMVSTTNRRVTAKLASGKEKLIYQNGRFMI